MLTNVSMACYIDQLKQHRRASMVEQPVSQMKPWRTRGLSFSIVYKHLFKPKHLQSLAYSFGLLHLEKWGKVHDKICETFDKCYTPLWG